MPTSFIATAQASGILAQFHDGQGSSATFTVPLTLDPVSTAFNNWRFSAIVRSGDHFSSSAIEFDALIVFEFDVPRRTRIRAYVHFLPLGTSRCRGNAKNWSVGVPGFDSPGRSSFRLDGFGSFHVRTPNGAPRFNTPSEVRNLQQHEAVGTDGQAIVSNRITSPEVGDRFVRLDSDSFASAGDRLQVVAHFRTRLSTQGGGFARADFSSSGLGLNAPMVIVRYLD